VTLKDKLEIGLKEDAPYRKDNLPASEVRGPEKPAGPGRSPEIPMARAHKTPPPTPARARTTARKPGSQRAGLMLRGKFREYHPIARGISDRGGLHVV
jgi:hypothetical protein